MSGADMPIPIYGINSFLVCLLVMVCVEAMPCSIQYLFLACLLVMVFVKVICIAPYLFAVDQDWRGFFCRCCACALQPERFVSLGIEPPKGVLLFGPPGTGKTLCARAVANRTDACFIRVIGSELVQKYVGEVSQ